MKKKILLIVLIVIIVAITATVTATLVSCEKDNHGIPRGTYKPCVNGEIGDWVLEDCWQIFDDAEYRYGKFSVIEDEKGVWFYRYNYTDDTTWKLKVEYDEESKILTVYMPENFPIADTDDEVKAYTFKQE